MLGGMWYEQGVTTPHVGLGAIPSSGAWEATAPAPGDGGLIEAAHEAESSRDGKASTNDRI